MQCRSLALKKKKMVPLTNKQDESYENAETCCITEKSLKMNILLIKKNRKATNHCYYTGTCRGAAHSKCNLKYSKTKGIPLIFHNGLNYDYNFIIKELAGNLKSSLPVYLSNKKDKLKKLV